MKILRYSELGSVKGVHFSRQHLARLERAGRFPRRITLGANSIGWIEDEIDAFLKARAEQRDTATPEVRNATT